MSSWYLAPALQALLDELNEVFPDRDKASDGTIGDAAHQAESFSDHNPDPRSTPPGVVRALDIDSNGPLGVSTPLVEKVLSAVIGDERAYYVIWDGKIMSRTYGWVPHVYTGPSAHLEHVHVSIQGHLLSETQAALIAGDTSPWLDPPVPNPTLPAVRLSRVVDAARHPRQTWAPVNVKRVQRALVSRRLLPPAGVTGIYGPSTRQAVGRFQRSVGYRGVDADGVLGVRSGTLLGADRYRLLP